MTASAPLGTIPGLALPALTGSRAGRRLGVLWPARYAARLQRTDALVLTVALGGLLLLRDRFATTPGFPEAAVWGVLDYFHLTALVGVVWWLALGVFDSRSQRHIGAGTMEYRRVFAAATSVAALILIGDFFVAGDLSRVYAVALVLTGTSSLLASRWLWRQWLIRQRRRHRYSHRVVLIGSSTGVAATARELSRNPGLGYQVVGAAVTDRAASPEAIAALEQTGAQLIGAVDDVPDVLDRYAADTVLATGSDDLSPARLRDLSWRLESGRHHLVVAPSLTDIGGSRIHLRPVAGLPLLHVEMPHFEGANGFRKRVFDIVGSAAILLALSPLFAVIAVLIARTSPGPVFYGQTRVGLGGREFRILKFRSMVPDADRLRADLTTDEGRGLFKMQDDPRITPIGRFLRKYSLDELPQLLNVLRGDMSLVGPRPALPAEVAAYAPHEQRRLVVVPGMSGLWQVSGRSDLDWEDGIRLDLFYVENWSMTQDLTILWRTAKAVLSSDGAY